MSAVPYPSNEVFAFSIPVVKGPRVEFALLVAGGMAELHAPRLLAVDLARSLADACGFELVVREKAHLKDFPTLAERRREYVAAYREFRAGKFDSMKACALAHGLSYVAFFQWCQRHATELEREYATPGAVGLRLPITKPGGALL